MDPLPSIDSLNSKSDEDAIATIRTLFESAPVLERYVLSLRPWTSYADIIARSEVFVRVLLKEGRHEDVLNVINAHPKIGADPKTLSADSKKEQGASADVDVLTRLAQLNDEYEKRFGFRFVVFVNGRSKQQILPVMEERLKYTKEVEMATALQAMMDIARDRLKKRSANL